MSSSIPASQLVQVLPGVLGAGGNPLSLNSVFLTNSTAVPMGAVMPFSTADSVGAFFGSVSTEALMAAVYFNGFDTSTKKPGTLYFAQYPAANVAAYLRGGSLASMTLTQLQALSGSLTVTIDGTVKTAASINLSAAASFSAAATTIGTALTAAVTWDAQRYAFVVTSGTTGASSTITVATGTLSAGLKLTAATGCVLSQGAVAAVPGTFMPTVVAQTQNWGTFTTLFEPTLSNKLLFAAWTNAQALRYAYVCWDSDAQAATSGNTANFGQQVKLATYEGVVPVYPALDKAAFICGAAASIDFNATNGRITFAFKGQSGLTADVTDADTANNLIANGYNFYGSYATANDTFTFLQSGQISGKWKWIDAYINQIYLNSQLQLSGMTLLSQINSLPYTTAGYDLVRAAFTDPIKQFVNFGGIRAGVPLSALQAAEVNTAAGLAIDGILTNVGYYLQILPASAQVRGNRGTPPCNLWYTDGGSIQKITLASIDVM